LPLIQALVELDDCHLAVGVDKGLLANRFHAFEVANVIAILAAKIAGMLALDLAVSLFLLARLLQSFELGFGKN
jgi:hypothetical protein